LAKRVHYIDALRVLAVLLLIPFHSARVFDSMEAFYAKNAVVSSAADWFINVVNLWHMPLLFLLAGASTYFALSHRAGRTFLGERTKRLLVPLVFGMLVILPPQGWFGAMTNTGYHGSLLTYWPSFFALRGDLSGYYGTITPGHLWFVLYLFVLSAAALPLLLWFRGRGEAHARAMSAALANPALWVAVVLVLMVSSALPAPGGKNPFYFLVWFVLGYLVMVDGRFAEMAERRRVPIISAALAAVAAFVLLLPIAGDVPRFTAADVGFSALRFAAGWLVVVACLGWGKRLLDRPSPLLAYASEASYPFYILHQTVIVAVAFYLVRLPWGVGLKYAALVVAALVLTVAGYEVVRRVGALRVVFGMKPLSVAATAGQRERQAS
jgi:glucans biosynthesis protein C